MIDLKIDNSFEITFRINIEGASELPNVRLSLLFEDFIFSIKGTVEKEKAKVIIPPLKNILKFKNDLSSVKGVFEVFIDKNYFVTWEDMFNFIYPVEVSVSKEEVLEKKEKPLGITIEVDSIKESSKETVLSPDAPASLFTNLLNEK